MPTEITKNVYLQLSAVFGAEEFTNPHGYWILHSHQPLYVPTDPGPKIDNSLHSTARNQTMDTSTFRAGGRGQPQKRGRGLSDTQRELSTH